MSDFLIQLSKRFVLQTGIGVILLMGVYLWRRNQEEEKVDPPAVAEEPVAEEAVVSSIDTESPLPPVEPTTPPPAPLGIGSTRQDVINALGEPTGEMTISGAETLYFDGIRIRLKQGVVTEIPPDAVERRQRALEEKAAPQTQEAEETGSQQTMKPSSRKNQMIRNGGRDIDLDSMISQGSIAIVDFFADWCGPCKQIEPHLKQMARDPGVHLIQIDTVKWDTPVSRKYNIRTLPDVRIFDVNGKQVGKGTHDLRKIQRNLEKAKKSS